jgi:putative ABC transport system permease protein
MTRGLWQDLKSACRALIAMRGAGVLAVLTLAVALGAATSMFSIVYAALLRPVPFDAPADLVMVFLTRTTPADGLTRLRFSFAEFTSLTNQVTSFEALGAFTRAANIALEVGDRPAIPTSGEFVSPSYWAVLRLRPKLGRLTTTDDDARRGAGQVAVLSARLWRDACGSDPHIVGQHIRVNGVVLSVIGVMGEGVNGLSERAELWMPATLAPQLTYADYLTTPQHFIVVIGRLGRGVTREAANRELAVLAPRIANGGQPDPDRAAVWGAFSTPINDVRVQPTVRRTALLLAATIVCILLVATANVMSVLLARLHDRRREIAVRRALGATPWQLLRQTLAENAVLAVVGGVLGAGFAAVAIRLVRVAGPIGLPSTGTGYIQISSFATPAWDAAVAGFLVAATGGVAALFTVIGIWEASRPHFTATLRDDARTGSRRRLRTLRAVVVIEMAGAVLLITGASLLAASARGLESQHAGFESADVLTFRVAPPASRYRPEDGPRILESLLTSIEASPGVAAAAVNRCAPLDDGCARATLYGPNRPDGTPVERHYISANYFRLLGMRVVAGRVLAATDRAGGALVTVVNETAARRFWPGQNPLGQHVWFSNPAGFDDPTHPIEVVGIVGDVKYGTVDQILGPDFYTSYLQFAFPDSMILVKATPGGYATLLPSIDRAVASVDRGLPIIEPMPLEARVQAAWATPRFQARAVVVFAALALVLAALGVYGVATVAVSLRARELGIRLAIGAEVRSIVRLVFLEHLSLALVGGALGVVAALLGGRLLQNLLYGVGASDPRAIAVALSGLLVAVLVGAVRPARRAGAINPVDLLRRE